MKLATSQISQFLNKPNDAVRVILIYGPDAGLVRERADQLAKKILDDPNDPFRSASLTGSMATEDPARLNDEMASQALGGGTRLIRLQQATESLSGPLNGLLGNMPESDSVLIIEAGELEKRSKLRAICESENPEVVAIACYVEEGAARQRVVADILQTEGLKISRDALAFLCDILPPDRLAMRSELEKLATYAKGSLASNLQPLASISIEDVAAIVQDAGAAELDDLIFAVGSGDARKAAQLLSRLLEEQTSTVAILRAAQRHFLRLQWARGYMDQGLSAGEAVKKLQPPVFWKYVDSMSNQMRRWPAAKLDYALHRLLEAEAAVKRTGTPDTTLCAQLLLGMAT